jgi:hypothetical protein
MLLKPFRSYDEHDVINLYSLAESSGNAGDLVQFQSWNPSDSDGYDINQNLSPFAGMSIPRYVGNAKVRIAPAGGDAGIVAGALLYDVRNTDALGRPLIYDAQRWNELQVVYSGQVVPICKRGILIVSGFSGTAAPGSGIGVGAQSNGQWSVIGPAVTPNLGKWMSTSGADGYAVGYLNC